MVWYTADHHFGHANIIRFCNRPWLGKRGLTDKGYWKSSDVAKNRCDAMDRDLIRRWNMRVKDGDIVYYLGDFAYRASNKVQYYIDQLNGNKIFIKGNHDKNNGLKIHMEFAVINMGGMRIKLIHDPKYADEMYDLNFCGHIHEKWKFKKMELGSYIINVGVDMWGFNPITFDEIISELNKWKRQN